MLDVIHITSCTQSITMRFLLNSLNAVLIASCSYRCSAVCLSVCLSVCLLGTAGSPAKMAESIEMPLGVWVQGNRVLDGVHIGATWQRWRNDLFGSGNAGCHFHYCSNLFVNCHKPVVILLECYYCLCIYNLIIT